jgi:gliding motility-associated-like protein
VKPPRLLLLLCLVLLSARSLATHVRAADLKVELMCGYSLTYQITVTAYLNSLSNTQFGANSFVIFGDGQQVRIPLTKATSRPDLGKNVTVAKFQVAHSYLQHGTYTLSYIERDRSTGVLNIPNSHDVPYVTQVTFQTSTQFGCNSFPVLPVPPLDRACHESIFYHTSGAYDIDGDSLSYELSVPLASESGPASYSSPAAQKFYLDYQHANEAKTSVPTFSINPLTGLLTWDSPGMVGEYNIAFKIIEWRKNPGSSTYAKLSTTVRDMQIVVEECDNIRPELQVPNDICIVAGTSISEIITGTDMDIDNVKIEVFSEIVDLPAAKLPGNYSPRPTTYVPSDPPASVQFNWQTDCLHVRQQPYQVVFKITDDPPEGPRLVNFKVWFIRVVATAPVWNNYALDLVKRTTTVSWDNYSCPNAKTMQVWRKVGSYAAVQGYCDTRPPSYWGYQLISEIPITQTSFTDDNFGRGLSVGAQYCYRLQATITDTRSYVSSEICVGPIMADAPVITHVSVEETSHDGDIRVSWRSPFNISKTQFPPPYQYEVYRANGFIGDSSIVKVGRVTDTTFVDKMIETDRRVYNYRIVLFARPLNSTAVVPVDTSAAASSVRLTGTSGTKSIGLHWKDSVAWSNVVEKRPYHLIYRAVESEDLADMVLIDSINVTLNGFYYTDNGTYNDEELQPNKLYSYRILTRGTYGNPKISLQENFSQVISLYPTNDLPVCKPALTAEIVNCEEYVAVNTCQQTEFSNTIRWSLKGLADCRRDVASYRVYAASSRDAEFILLAENIRDTVYVDEGLSSFARCYRVAALDRMGEESILSDSVCNDNCPMYELPNVFTPNDDGSNDTFRPFEGPDNRFPGVIPCPRFVREVEFKVYDRWGKEVFRYNDAPIGLRWDGVDANGVPIDAGLYYYTAELSFDVLDDSKRTRSYKGWVHLIR